MKTKKKLPKKYLSTQDANLLERLILSAKERFTVKDIVLQFLDSLDWREREKMIEQLLNDENVKDDLKLALKSEMTTEGFLILKIDSMDKKDKLTDFIETLYPYHNDQQKLFNS